MLLNWSLFMYLALAWLGQLRIQRKQLMHRKSSTSLGSAGLIAASGHSLAQHPQFEQFSLVAGPIGISLFFT
jgi:hypothetical protein